MPAFFQDKNRAYAAIAIAVLCLYLLPFIVLGPNIKPLVHDTIDSTIVWYKLLSESGQMFGPLGSTVPQIMGGLPRNTLFSEINFVTLSFHFLGMLPAYVLNVVLIHAVALAGMWLLLKKHFLKEEKYLAIAAGCAIAFALLPFWPLGGLSVAGLPLALYAFLNIRQKPWAKKDWLIIIAMPFFASFIYSFVFFLFGMLLLWLYDLWKAKKPNMAFFAAMAAMAAIFLAAEYRLAYSMFFDPSYVTHRIEFQGYPTDFLRVALRSGRSFLFGQYHAASMHLFIILPTAAAALLMAFLKKAKFRMLLLLLTILAAIALFGETISGWAALEPLKAQVSILKTFAFNRFYFLAPLLWGLVFAFSLKIIFDNLKHGKRIALALIILQVALLFCYFDGAIQPGGLGIIIEPGQTWGEFYSEPLFGEISDFIGKAQSSYKIVNIGISPGIAQYNGFYTLDGYSINYPLEFKHRFREIIEKELGKSPSLEQYFDGWGSKCYIFAAELGGKVNCTKGTCPAVENLELNTQTMKEMGAEYVFSAVEIKNAAQNNFEFQKTFESQGSPWKIWLYKVE